MNIVFIAAHMGGGVGKAISGIAIQSSKKYKTSVTLLEGPKETKYINQLKENGVFWSVAPTEEEMLTRVAANDVVILCWWCHPLMIKCLFRIRQIPCRMIIWNHVNGCNYPFLPAKFLQLFSQIAFTSPASLENKLWSNAETEWIKNNSAIVYGMGNFKPENICPKSDYKIHNGHPVVGYVGTISYEKINRNFIDYCDAAVKAIPNVEFKMVGRPAVDFLSEVHNKKLESHFDFLGYTEDPAEAYRSFDIFGYLLQPESYATTENVLLEAMAYGLPIIVLDNPIERQIIQDGQNGYLVNSKEEYVAKLTELIRSEETRKHIGALARHHVIAKYDCGNNFERFCDSVERSMERAPAPVDVTPLFSDGYEAFCYFSGIDIPELDRKLQADPHPLIGYALSQRGESKASIAQYCHYFPDNEKLLRLLAATAKNNTDN